MEIILQEAKKHKHFIETATHLLDNELSPFVKRRIKHLRNKPEVRPDCTFPLTIKQHAGNLELDHWMQQQKDLKLKVSGDLYNTQVLDKMAQPDWQIRSNVLVMHHGYSIDKEDQRSITLKKGYRKIEQDNLLQRISARGSQFDRKEVEMAPV